MKLFEYATRNKIRFEYKGLLSVEDLWDLNLKQLDAIYKELMKDKKDTDDEGLLTTVNDKDDLLTVKIEIVKYIFSVKNTEITDARMAAEKKAKKQKIMELIEKKNDQALENASTEELQKMLAELD